MAKFRGVAFLIVMFTVLLVLNFLVLIAHAYLTYLAFKP